MIEITRLSKDGSTEEVGRFAVDGLSFIDIVFHLVCRKTLYAGDELRISFNVPVVSYVDCGLGKEETNRYTEDWEYSSGIIEEDTLVTHFRFTKIGKDAWIKLLDGMPDALYRPYRDGAQKIR